MADPGDYRALPGRVAAPLYSARLYQGRDHLLKSTVVGFHEHFRRFAWEDIQAFIVEETPWSGVTNLLLALVFLMQLVSFATFTDKTPGILAVYLPFLILIGALMAVNFLRGPTCKTYLLTAVTRERLWSLNRVRKARAVIDSLAPLIRERQAAAQPAAGGGADAFPETAGAEPDVPKLSGKPEKLSKPVERARWHLLACLLVAFFMIQSAIELAFRYESEVWDGISLAGFGFSCLVCAAALISQSRNRAPRSVRAFGWVLLGFHVISTMMVFAMMFAAVVFTARHPELAKSGGFEIKNQSWYIPSMAADLAMETIVFLFGAIVLMGYRKVMLGTGKTSAAPAVSGPAQV